MKQGQNMVCRTSSGWYCDIWDSHLIWVGGGNMYNFFSFILWLYMKLKENKVCITYNLLIHNPVTHVRLGHSTWKSSLTGSKIHLCPSIDYIKIAYRGHTPFHTIGSISQGYRHYTKHPCPSTTIWRPSVNLWYSGPPPIPWAFCRNFKIFKISTSEFLTVTFRR